MAHEKKRFWKYKNLKIDKTKAIRFWNWLYGRKDNELVDELSIKYKNDSKGTRGKREKIRKYVLSCLGSGACAVFLRLFWIFF